MDPHEKLLKIFYAAIDAVKPDQLLGQILQRQSDRVTISGNDFLLKENKKLKLIAIGKAAAGMALAAKKILGDAITAGICITKTGHGQTISGFTCIEAEHPIPGEGSLRAANALTQFVLNNNSPTDIVLLLISGGASALLADLPVGISLADIQQLNKALVNSGATIAEINTVRKHFSTLKGGQLARLAAPATIITLAISDVAGDSPTLIGSGLTAPDRSTFADAEKVLNKYGLIKELPPPLLAYLANGLRGIIAENPTVHDSCFKNTRFQILANNEAALMAAKQAAREITPHCSVFPGGLNNSVDDLTATIVQELISYRGPLPACFIWGGEPLLKVDKPGKGGRCQHLALSIIHNLNQLTEQNVSLKIGILAAATDGTDGPTDAAGAIASWPDFGPEEEREQRDALQLFNAFDYWKTRNSLLFTGPTQTNVNDLGIAWLEKMGR